MNKTALFSLSILALMVACTNNPTENNENEIALNNKRDSIISDSPDKSLCFLKLDGTKGQDSTYVYMHLKGDSITGIYNSIPEMKDARKGIIKGVKLGDTLNVVWSFMQEGIIDTIHTQFILEGDKLKQQPFLTLKDGKQVRDRDAAFEIAYNSVSCPVF